MIRHLQYIIANQSIRSKPKLVCQEQTFPKAQLVDQELQTDPQEPLANPQPVKDIDTVSTQTDQDEVILSNLTKISKLEMDISKMDHNQDLLLLELNLQKKDNIALQAEITIMTKRMAKVTYANNLYHVTLIEQNCSLPNEAENFFSSLSNCGQAEDLHSNSIIQPSKKQGAIFQKVQVDTKTLKKDHHIATLLPLKEDPTQPPKKEANKTLNKELAWISKMSQALTKLEKKFAIPIEKRKPGMFKRKTKTNHIIPKPFRTMFHLLAAPEPDPVTLPDPYPTVDWYSLRFKPALPNPEDCPVYSASKDPDDYQMKSTGISHDPQYSTFTRKNPFGALPGYRTTQGVVSVPATSVQGFIYCPTARRWLLHASLNPVGRRPAGRGCPGTSRGERERGKKPHSLP
jgi:hypothetical protein